MKKINTVKEYLDSLDTFDSFDEFEKELKKVEKEEDISSLLKKMDLTLYKNKELVKTIDWHYLSKIVNEKVRSFKKPSSKNR